MSDLQKLRNQRAEVVTQMRTLHATAEKEERRFTEDEDNKWNVMVADLEKLDARIRRADQLDAAGQVVPSSLRAANQLIDQQNDDKKAESDDEKRVFEKFLRHGIGGLSQEERSLMAARRARGDRPPGPSPKEPATPEATSCRKTSGTNWKSP